MLERLVEYVAEASEENISELLAQDMAIFQTWLEASGDDSATQERFKAAPQNIARWQQSNIPSNQETEGRRHQILTRILVDTLEADSHQELHRDENAHLSSRYKILQGVHNADQHTRNIEILEPHFHILEKRRNAAQPVAHLPRIAKSIQYATEKDISGAPVRDTRLLAGIELPCRGPVMYYSTNLQIIGDVPENSTVVLKDEGLCCVDGYLMGRI